MSRISPFPFIVLFMFTLLMALINGREQTNASVPTTDSSATALPLLSSFSTITNSGEMLGTIAVGNVDDDAALEIVVNSNEGIHVYDINGTLVSSFSTQVAGQNRAVNAVPSLVDIDNDDRDEIIFATGRESDTNTPNSVFAINGEDGSMVWEMPINRSTYSSPDSGYQTIGGAFYYNGTTHAQLPDQTWFTANAAPVPIYDIDDDGRLEAVVNLKIRPEPVQDYNPYINDVWGFADWGTVGESWSGGNFIVHADNGQRDMIYHFVQLSEAGMALGYNEEGKGTAVFTLTDSDSVVGYHASQPHGFYGSGNLIGQFGKNSRIISGSYKHSVALNAADITGDGKAEVFYESHNIGDLLWQGSRVIFDDQGHVLWRKWYDFPNTSGLANIWPNASQMIPINVDGLAPEVISWHHTNQLFYETWDGVELVNKGGNWPVYFGAQFPSPPVVGDVDGDGQEEFVVARYDPTNLNAAGGITILGQDGSVEDSIDTGVGIKNIPNLFDVDRDGDLDIIVRDLDGTVLIYDTEAGDPTQVSWATEARTNARTGAMDMPLYPAQAPVIDETTSGYGRVRLSWQMQQTTGLTGFTVYRKVYGEPMFSPIADLIPAARQFEDDGLENGRLYMYQIGTRFGSDVYFSAPIPALPLVENNLAQNSGFELNGDNNWDKWYTGDIAWQDMIKTSDQAYQGDAAMRIHLDNKDDNSSISQWNQYGIIDAQIPVTPGQIYSYGAFIKTNLNQNSEHFIEWSSTYNRTRHDPTNDPIPLPQFPFYFSTHLVTPPGASEWLYTNRVFTVQPGITAVSNRHRFYIDGNSATGDVYLDNLFFRKVGTESPEAQTLLPFESNWRYLDGIPASNWYTTAFNDNNWPVGQAKFGNGSGPDNINTYLPRYRDQFYFRNSFTLDEDLVELIAYAKATTGPNGGPGIKEIYLNGQHIPIQDPGLTDNPGNDVRMLDLTPFIPLLTAGQNTIAIKLENEYQANNWDDLAFDFQLKGIALVPHLEAAKQAQPVVAPAGEIISYTIRLDNPGVALTGVLVTDTLPAELIYQNDVLASSGNIATANGQITWQGDIPAAGVVLITYSAQIDPAITSAQPIINTAVFDDRQGSVFIRQAQVIANGSSNFLPMIYK